MTTSVFLQPSRHGWPPPPARPGGTLREHFVVVGRLVIGSEFDVHALLIPGDHRAHAGIAEQIPAYEVCVSAVIGITEHALDVCDRAPGRRKSAEFGEKPVAALFSMSVSTAS